jgi:hypothetical protein
VSAASVSVSRDADRSVPLRRATWLSCRQLRASASVPNVFRIVFWSADDHTCAWNAGLHEQRSPERELQPRLFRRTTPS